MAAAAVRAQYEMITEAGLWHRRSLLDFTNTMYRLASTAYWRNDGKKVECRDVWEHYTFARIERGMDSAEAELLAIRSLGDATTRPR